MSEQDEREQAEARIRIAGSQVECPYLDHGPGTLSCKCGGTGKVYRFGAELRVPCWCKGKFKGHGLVSCGQTPGCDDRGWVPPENFFALLVVELDKAGHRYGVTDEEAWIYSMPDQKLHSVLHHQNPEAALYRQVLAVLGAA